MVMHRTCNAGKRDQNLHKAPQYKVRGKQVFIVRYCSPGKIPREIVTLQKVLIMAKEYTTTGGTTFDMNDPAVNPDAKNVTTPREGGFTLRNRINFSNPEIVAAGANMLANNGAAGAVANIFKILTVPARVSIKSLRILKVPGESNFAGAHTSAGASNSGATMGIGTRFAKNASGSLINDVDALADHAITKSTGALPTTFFSGAASTPGQWDVSQSDTSAPVLPLVAPYGGDITMHIVDGSGGASASSDAIKMTGVFEVVADCDYMPV